MTGTASASTAPQIRVGTHVEFDSADQGPQSGTVVGFIRSIENGQQHAAIEIDHELDGIVWTMPTAALTPSAPTQIETRSNQ